MVSKYHKKNHKRPIQSQAFTTQKQHRRVTKKINNALIASSGDNCSNATDSEALMCGICLFYLYDNTPIINSDRYHLFHIECLRPFLIVNPRAKCPLCRRTIWESTIETMVIVREEDWLHNFSQQWFYAQNFITQTIYKVHFTNNQKTGLYTNSLLDVEEYGENPWFLNVMEDGLRFKIVIKDGNNDIDGQRKLADDFLVQHASNVKAVSQFKHVVQPWSSTSANVKHNTITTTKWLCNLISNVWR